MGVCIAAALQTVCRRVRNSEIPMADPDDRSRHEGVSPDGRPRRQPPIIDVEAVEVSLDGSRTTTAGSGPPASPSGAMRSLKRILTLLAPMKVVIIGSVCVIAAIIGGALWIYLAPDGIDGPQRNAASWSALSATLLRPPALPVSVPTERLVYSPYALPRVGRRVGREATSRIGRNRTTAPPLRLSLIASRRSNRGKQRSNRNRKDWIASPTR